MGGDIIWKGEVLTTVEWRRGWSWGTLYVQHDDLVFDPRSNRATPAAQCIVLQHRWSDVVEVRWRRGFPLGAVEIVHLTGAQVYRGFGAKRLARLLQGLHARTRAPVVHRLAA